MPASMVARCGPQLRSPIGGNFAAAAKARASAAVLIIGAMMPSAPKSSTRLTISKSPSGTRTIGADPACRTAAMPIAKAARSHMPCCESSVTAAKPSRATTSATIGAGSPHQPVWTVSPARRRAASEKPDSDDMRFLGVALCSARASLAFDDRDLILFMRHSVLPLDRFQEGIDPGTGIVEPLRHLAPLVIVEDHRAAVVHERPGHHRIGVHFGRAMAA